LIYNFEVCSRSIMIFHVKMTHESLDKQKLFVTMICKDDLSISKELTDIDKNSIIWPKISSIRFFPFENIAHFVANQNDMSSKTPILMRKRLKDDHLVNWDASSRWSSSWYYPTRKSDQMIIEKTCPTLLYKVISRAK